MHHTRKTFEQSLINTQNQKCTTFVTGTDLSYLLVPTGSCLRYADLSDLTCCGIDLGGINLSGAALRRANLTNADFTGATLRHADLRGANLTRATFTAANLNHASLAEARVYKTRWPAPTQVLLADWGEVSDELCVELMRYDAANHPKPIRFNEWANGGPCPYNKTKIERAAIFWQKRKLWSPGPARSALELMKMLLKEKCITSKE